jgi:hypothetical protein
MSLQPANKDNAGTQSGIIYHSSDGGKTWEDISTGLHDSLKPNSLSVHEGELWLGASDGLYRGTRYIHRDNLGKNTARRPGTGRLYGRPGRPVHCFILAWYLSGTSRNRFVGTHAPAPAGSAGECRYRNRGGYAAGRLRERYLPVRQPGPKLDTGVQGYQYNPVSCNTTALSLPVVSRVFTGLPTTAKHGKER